MAVSGAHVGLIEFVYKPNSLIHNLIKQSCLVRWIFRFSKKNYDYLSPQLALDCQLLRLAGSLEVRSVVVY